MTAMLKVFFSPGDAFRRVREKPAWIAPLIVVFVFMMGASYLVMSKINYADQRTKIEEMMRERGMSEDQIQQRLEQQDKFMANPTLKYVVPMVSSVVVTAIGLLIVSAILMLLVPTLGAANSSFMLNLAIVANAALIRVVAVIVRMGLLLARGVENTSTSLSLAAPKLTHGFLANFLSRIDVFAIWEVIVLALGVKVVYDLKDRRSYIYLIGLWLIYNLAFSFLPGAGMRPH